MEQNHDNEMFLLYDKKALYWTEKYLSCWRKKNIKNVKNESIKLFRSCLINFVQVINNEHLYNKFYFEVINSNFFWIYYDFSILPGLESRGVELHINPNEILPSGGSIEVNIYPSRNLSILNGNDFMSMINNTELYFRKMNSKRRWCKIIAKHYIKMRNNIKRIKFDKYIKNVFIKGLPDEVIDIIFDFIKYENDYSKYY